MAFNKSSELQILHQISRATFCERILPRRLNKETVADFLWLRKEIPDDLGCASYQQREYERIEHPDQFPTDYFFSALAELVLDD